VALIAGAWVLIVAAFAAGNGAWFGHEQLAAGPAGWPVLAAWAAMTVAMMGPSCLPLARYVSANTLRPRPAVVGFFAAYLVVWLGFLALFAVADTAAHATVGEGSAAVTGGVAGTAFLVAAVWQLSAVKRRFVLACRTVELLPARGGVACRRLGLRQGASCVGSCGPLMLATMSAPYGRLLWMPLLAALAWLEKAAGRRRRLAKPTAVLLGATAMIYIVAGVH
jgi:predicted metal-binding membrane protein